MKKLIIVILATAMLLLSSCGNLGSGERYKQTTTRENRMPRTLVSLSYDGYVGCVGYAGNNSEIGITF